MERRTLMYGVSSGQWGFLRQLWLEDGLTQCELTARVGMRAPTTVTAVNSLVRSGLVERVPSQTDRRKIHIYLTQLAKDLQADLMPMVEEVNDLATQGIDADDLAVFRKVLIQLNVNLSKEADLPVIPSAA